MFHVLLSGNAIEVIFSFTAHTLLVLSRSEYLDRARTPVTSSASQIVRLMCSVDVYAVK